MSGGALAGRVALVSGSSRGIGRAIAERFAREGADVAITWHRSDEAADALARRIEKEGGRAVSLQLDVTERASIRRCIDRTIEAFGQLDVVVAAVPGSPATADMFDQRFFEAMRAGSVFINVGRGVSVDEAALIDALASGHLRAAAIDVAKREPLPADDPLWDAPNLFISPHSSGAGSGYMDRMWDLFCDNLERFRSGRPRLNVVDVHTEYG